MNFLLNMNISSQLGRLLETQGHGWRHVRDLGMAGAEDRSILETAKEHGEVVLTHDLDYGHLLAFSGDVRPSVIIFRRRSVLPEDLFMAVHRNWPELSSALEAGALVILEDSALRIRPLPIGRS